MYVVQIHIKVSPLLHLAENEGSDKARAWLIENGEAFPVDFLDSVLAAIDRDDLDSASSAIRQWHEQYPTDDTSELYAAYLSLLNGDFSTGIEALENIVQVDSGMEKKIEILIPRVKLLILEDNPAYQQLGLGRLFASIGEWHLARVCFSRSIQISPGYAEAWALLGEAKQQLGMDGKPELDQAERCNASSVIVQVYLGYYWRRQGDYDRALDYFQHAASQEPYEPMWQVEMAQTYALIGDINRAMNLYQKAADLGSSQSIYWQLLARFSADYDMDINSIGLPAARKALLLSPDDPNSAFVMGNVLFKLLDFAGAERFLQQAVEESDLPSAHVRLAQIYLQQSRMDEAYQQLQIVVRSSSAASSEVQLAHRLLQQYFDE